MNVDDHFSDDSTNDFYYCNGQYDDHTYSTDADVAYEDYEPNGDGYYCEPCDLEFATNNEMHQHVEDEHEMCAIDGCTFSTHRDLLEAHVSARHVGADDVMGSIRDTATPEDIERWKAQRRLRFPTRARVECLQKQSQEREQRGERIAADCSRFGDKRNSRFALPDRKLVPPQLAQRGFKRKRQRQRRVNRNDQKKSLIDSKADWNEGMFPFPGTSELYAEPTENGSEYDDEEWRSQPAPVSPTPTSTTKERVGQRVSRHPHQPTLPDAGNGDGNSDVARGNALGSLMNAYGDSDSDNNDECDGAEGAAIMTNRSAAVVNVSAATIATSACVPETCHSRVSSSNTTDAGGEPSCCYKANSGNDMADAAEQVEEDDDGEAPREEQINRQPLPQFITEHKETGAENAIELNVIANSGNNFQLRATTYNSNYRRERNDKYVTRDARAKPCGFNQIRFRKRKSTLLEKLLDAEIRKERNVIMQCVRFIVNNNFLNG